MIKYKCLCLDHDDTVVNSTATIHYPCFVEYLDRFRPGVSSRYSFEEYLRRNFSPGVLEMFRDDLGFSPEEIAAEEKYWERYVEGHIPAAYPGFADLLRRYRAEGGIIAVDSHSLTHYIRRDYLANGLPMPDVIYGWDLPPEKRKPAPDTLFDLFARFSLSPSDVLVVDDLKPGFDMARAAGAVFAAAGWAYDVPEIARFMRAHSDFYLSALSDLEDLLFGK